MSYRLPVAPLRRRLAPSSVTAVTKRFASTSAPRPGRRYLSTTLLLGGGVLGLAYYYDSRSLLHEHVVMPITRLVADPEEGHKLAVRVLSWEKWARPRDMGVDGPELQAELFGHKLTNPLGIAAGFDKDASAIDGLFDLGFGYVEVGSITPEPQPGNPTPRFFRLEEDDAAINRYGFNSLGHGQALNRLRERVVRFSRDHPSLFPAPLSANPLPPAALPRSLRPGQLLAVNLGKNKTSAADSNEDYIRGVRTFGPYADVLIINVSSPNTPGLRALQGRKQLESLLGDVVKERNRLGGDGLPKIAVKVTADLGEEELADVAGAVRSSGVEGVIVSNTTIRRQELNLKSANQHQIGGLSGKPLFPYALQSLKTLRPLLPPSIPLIGCGGVSTGSDAVEMANAGASLVQVYTSFGYRGVGTPRLIKDEITESLKSQGGASWSSQVGKDWMGKEGGVAAMGWDENRIKHEAELLKTEAASLASLLREAGEKQDLGRLVAEAEKALGLRKGEEQQLVKEGKATKEQQQVEAGQAQKQVSQPSIGEALISDPVGKVDLGPIVVLDEQKVRESALIEEKREREAEWSREAKQGAKRLV